MEVRIIGIAPVMDVFKEGAKAEEKLFWVYYPQARDVLSKVEVLIMKMMC